MHRPKPLQTPNRATPGRILTVCWCAGTLALAACTHQRVVQARTRPAQTRVSSGTGDRVPNSARSELSGESLNLYRAGAIHGP